MPGFIGASTKSTDLLAKGQPNCDPTSPLQPLPEHGFGSRGPPQVSVPDALLGPNSVHLPNL